MDVLHAVHVLFREGVLKDKHAGRPSQRTRDQLL